MTINEFLVKRLSMSNTDILNLIIDKKVLVNGKPAIQKQQISTTDQIISNGVEIQSSHVFQYLAYYKPPGIECTLNPDIENSLLSVLPLAKGLFPVGRLDKASEGLLLLTNDGKLYRQIAPAEQVKEKEYMVVVDKILTSEAIERMATGIIIMGKLTKPARVSQINHYSFNIVLTQGLNRQIRRMCYKLGYEVEVLKRTRIMSLQLGNLKPGEYRNIYKEDVFAGK